MAFPNSVVPVVDGAQINPYYIQADDSTSSTNFIPPVRRSIVVSGVTNNREDYVELPNVADVPNGHEITIHCAASSDFTMQTPASSDTKINNIDSDGASGYYCTGTEVMKVVKVSNTQGWVAFALTKAGAQAAAVVPYAISGSPSASISSSPSKSISTSPSRSVSISPSLSPSTSLSKSPSISSSISLSRSPSISVSVSPTESTSPSASSSISPSKSPSVSPS